MSMFMLNNSILFGSMWTGNLMGNPREENLMGNILTINKGDRYRILNITVN